MQTAVITVPPAGNVVAQSQAQPGSANYPMASLYVGDLAPEVNRFLNSYHGVVSELSGANSLQGNGRLSMARHVK